jgi:hypothetical protein
VVQLSVFNFLFLPEGNAMPANPAELSALLARLRAATILPLPPDEPWEEMIKRISTVGVVAEVLEETYDYFLEVLPPHWMGFGFAFAEGEEALRYFWKSGEKHFCQQLTWEETV